MYRCILFMSICVLSNQLMSMQELLVIDTAEALKELAIAIKPEKYIEALGNYEIKPIAVTNSISALFDSQELPEGMDTYVENECACNEKYKIQIIQIMHAYRMRKNGEICPLDQLNAKIYAELNKKIAESKALDEREVRCWQSGIGGTVCAITFGLVDFVLLMLWVANKS